MSSASEHASGFDPMDNSLQEQPQQAASKKKRNLPGTPDPDAEVIALSPRTLMATNRFVCEVCGKGFQRDQNLQLHRRGHNLPWRLKQRDEQEIRKRVYVCPEVSCVHHDRSRALGDLTGIKKHFFRKHGDKNWKCEKCSKRYAVQSDWKAHQKVCGTREYRCDCGTLFSRRDSFITHRAFCDALAEENAKASHQVENQQYCNEPDRGTGVRRASSGTEASSLSFPHFTSGPLDTETSTPPAREASRLGPAGLMEEGVIMSSLSSKRESESKPSCRPSIKGPALSLCLGTAGPGPGPPGLSMQMMGCFPRVDNMLSTSKGVVLGSGSDESMHNWPPSSASGLGMFASMLESSINAGAESWREFSSTNSELGAIWLGQSLGDQPSNTTSSMAGVSLTTIDSSIKNNSALSSQFAPSSPGSIVPSLSFLGNGYLPFKPSSNYHHHRHAGTAQLPATALLQKAALMGATSSTSSSLFHSFGGVSATTKEAQRESLLGVSSSLSSSSNWPLSSSRENRASGYGYGVERAEGSLYPAFYNQGQGSVQEFLNSLCSGAAGGSVFQSNSDDTRSSLSNGSGSVGVDHNNRNHHLMGPCNPLMFKESVCQDGSTLVNGLVVGGGSVQGGDKSSTDGGKTTLDFLGVGGIMARTLSQREIASITTLSTGIKGEPAATSRKSNLAG